MIKQILIITAALYLASCTGVNSSDDKTVTHDGDTVADVEVSVSKLDALTNLVEEEAKKDEKVLLKAHGSEPGWTAEFYNHKLRLVLDYGKDSLIVDDSFEDVNNAEGFTYNKTLSIDNKAESIKISIQNKLCTDAAGKKSDRSVNITYNNSIYNGCGGL